MGSKKSPSQLNKRQKELIAFLFDDQPHVFSGALSSWVAGSPRYAAFADDYRDKIRKKLRVTRDRGAKADLLAELQVGYWLLQERRFDLAYEANAAGSQRSPDYSVTYRSNFHFAVEVTHVRGAQANMLPAETGSAALNFRLIDVLSNKLRQMLPGAANLLFVLTPMSPLGQLDLAAHLAWIQDKAESRDSEFYARHRFRDPADFFKHLGQLSGLLMADTECRLDWTFWWNPQARIPLTKEIQTIFERGLCTDALKGRTA
jgi:hypothetical protein